MALFNKLFFSSSAAANNKRNNNHHTKSKNHNSQFPFDAGQVRILLFRECDSRGRRLLFDSSALQEVSLQDIGVKPNNTDKIVEDNININSFLNNGVTQAKHHGDGLIQTPDGCTYKHNRPQSPDIPIIGEMIFGALAMSFRGTAFKVHWLQSPSRMLCSQVFLSPMNNNEMIQQPSSGDRLHAKEFIGREKSINGYSMNSNSTLFDREKEDTRKNFEESNGITISQNVRADDLVGYSERVVSKKAEAKPTSSVSYQYSTKCSTTLTSFDSESTNSCDLSFLSQVKQNRTSNDKSIQRRISRNLKTSFENQDSLNDFIGLKSDQNFQSSNVSSGTDNYLHRNSVLCNDAKDRHDNTDIRSWRDSRHVHKSVRRARLGLAVCITMSESFEDEMERYCSEHIALIESMLGRLRMSTEKAYVNHKEFFQIMISAWQGTAQWITDLFIAPRITTPVWFSLTVSDKKHAKNVADRFLNELCALLSMADTKDTNFFISTTLTAVLTHNLGWVSTISNLKSSNFSAAVGDRGTKLLKTSHEYPYNVLWAQMSDLYGSIGSPPKLCRTIIYGTEKLPIQRLLHILTYFIRCGEVRCVPKVELFNKDLIDELISNQKKDTLSSKITSISYEKTVQKCPSDTTISTNSNPNVSALATNKETVSSSEDTISRSKENTSKVFTCRDIARDQKQLRESSTPSKGERMTNVYKQSTDHVQRTDSDEKISIKPLGFEARKTDEAPVPKGVDADDVGLVEAIEIESRDSKRSKVRNRTSFWKPPVKEGLSWADLHKTTLVLKDPSLEKTSNRTEDCSNNNSKQMCSELKPSNEKLINFSQLIAKQFICIPKNVVQGIESTKEAFGKEGAANLNEDNETVQETIKKDNEYLDKHSSNQKGGEGLGRNLVKSINQVPQGKSQPVGCSFVKEAGEELIEIIEVEKKLESQEQIQNHTIKQRTRNINGMDSEVGQPRLQCSLKLTDSIFKKLMRQNAKIQKQIQQPDINLTKDVTRKDDKVNLKILQQSSQLVNTTMENEPERNFGAEYNDLQSINGPTKEVSIIGHKHGPNQNIKFSSDKVGGTSNDIRRYVETVAKGIPKWDTERTKDVTEGGEGGILNVVKQRTFKVPEDSIQKVLDNHFGTPNQGPQLCDEKETSTTGKTTKFYLENKSSEQTDELGIDSVGPPWNVVHIEDALRKEKRNNVEIQEQIAGERLSVDNKILEQTEEELDWRMGVASNALGKEETNDFKNTVKTIKLENNPLKETERVVFGVKEQNQYWPTGSSTLGKEDKQNFEIHEHTGRSGSETLENTDGEEFEKEGLNSQRGIASNTLRKTEGKDFENVAHISNLENKPLERTEIETLEVEGQNSHCVRKKKEHIHSTIISKTRDCEEERQQVNVNSAKPIEVEATSFREPACLRHEIQTQDYVEATSTHDSESYKNDKNKHHYHGDDTEAERSLEQIEITPANVYCNDTHKTSKLGNDNETHSQQAHTESQDRVYEILIPKVSKVENEDPVSKYIENEAHESKNCKIRKVKKSIDLNLLLLPVPGVKEEDFGKCTIKSFDANVKTGFVPSLLLGITNHYVADVILQGTITPPHIWEGKVREELTLVTSSSSLVSMPTVNVAVVGDMENWDVKVLSSQQKIVPCSNALPGPIGMSQLVASMLETVFTMYKSGISAYECLSFLEAKLREIYMRSEALAAYLLTNNFCTLNSITTALNLTENDIPLLLSIASVHTPQISKFGNSFR